MKANRGARDYKIEFVAVFVSIKCRSSFSHNDAPTVSDKMKVQATIDELKRLCLLILLDSGTNPESEPPTVELRKSKEHGVVPKLNPRCLQ